ncbi:secreted insulinase like peptidase [Cryptosporidium ryanae]|uniref:secreted insulinase like peptidase n=1 Tax=Cryptosporidium ryanae TaxID=515981 RepID=UPI00351A8915|nr:secreted insulinase like peptidase [Cryptosporidium ryanae]
MNFNILVFSLLYVLLKLYFGGEHKHALIGTQTSFLELSKVESELDLESYQYMDDDSKRIYKLRHKTFNNGLTLMHLGGHENSRSELRIVIGQGVSSDNIKKPGIRFLALSILGSYIQACIFSSSKGKSDLSVSVSSETVYSRIKFSINGDSGALIDCITKAAKTREKYYDLESNFGYVDALTRDFQRRIDDPLYSSVDLMIVKEFMRAKLGFESEMLQLCNAFSSSNYNKIATMKDSITKQIGEILKSLRTPSLLSIIYVGDMSYLDLQKRLSFFTDLKSSELVFERINFDSFYPLRPALHSGKNFVLLRKSSNEEVLRVLIPFNTENLNLVVSSSFQFVANLLDSRHRKGIVNFLFANIFVFSVEVDYKFVSGSVLMSFALVLTKKGVKNIPVIVDSIFSYLNLIKKSAISNKLFMENQQVFDEKIKRDPLYMAELSELYFGIRKSFGLPVENALAQNLGTQFNQDEVDEILSRMDLSSSFVLFTLKNNLSLNELFFTDRLKTTELFTRNMAERYSNTVFTPLNLEEFYSGQYSDFDSEHAREFYNLDLPYTDMSKSTSLPNFALDSMSSKVYLLHRAVSEAYGYIASDTVVSKTMSFKSKLTQRIWYSNTKSYGLNVDVLLRFSVWFWAPGFDGIFGDVGDKNGAVNERVSTKIVSAIHILSAYLKLKTGQILAKMLRFDGHLGFSPAQIVFDEFSAPFELYLSVRAPANYLTFIFDQITQILNKEISIEDKDFEEIHMLARESLLKHYQSIENNNFISKIVSQMVSPTQHTFYQLDRALEEGVSIEHVRLVAKTLFTHSKLRGRIFGNITPFQANHVINVFLKSINHAYFDVDTPSSLPHSQLPFSGGILKYIDLDTIPENLRKTFYRRMDYVSGVSSAAIILFIGPVSFQQSYTKALVLNELYKKTISSEFSEKSKYKFSSRVLFSVSEFVSVQLNLESRVEESKNISKKLYSKFKDANKKIPRLLNSMKSSKKILLRAVGNIKINESSFVFASFYHENFYKKTLEFIEQLSQSDLKSLLSGIAEIPNLFVAHHRVSNINAAIASDDFVPSGYTVISDPKVLINSKVDFRECHTFEDE